MPLCDKRKVFHIHIPRCGGSMIEKALGIYRYDYPNVHEDILFGRKDNRELQHLTYDEAAEFHDLKRYQSFAIVRNPIDRFISVCNRRRTIIEESNDISFDSLLFDSAYMIVVEVKCDLLDGFGVQDLRIVPKYISTLEEGYGRVADYNILFIGNSFTFYNDMPTMVMDIGLSNDLDIRVEQISYGGYDLSDYIEDSSDDLQEVIDKLGEREWDYVILQEHSSKPYYDKEEFLSSVDTLSQIIKDNGAEVILFSTWSYRDGSSKLSSTGLTYTEFYNALTSAYEEAAELSNTSIAPVGTAFYNLTMEQPEINLLVSDDFHPRVEGSYVTAYIFYTQIFGEENNNEYTPSGLSNETLIILREYAVEALNLS